MDDDKGRVEVRWETYDLLLGHASEAPGVGGLTTLASDLLDLFLGTVGKVAWVGVVCHVDD